MNFNTAHRINQEAYSLGADYEDEVREDLEDLKEEVNKQKKEDLSSEERALLLNMVEGRLSLIEAAQLQALEQATAAAYLYSLTSTLDELDEDIVDVDAAVGYDASWCKGIAWNERVIANIGGLREEITGLVLGWTGDPLLLFPMIEEMIEKAKHEWERLIRTELEASWSMATRDSYLMTGTKYAIIENDDPCDAICADEVGEHEVPMIGAIGIDLPPYHPYCRCVFIGTHIE